MKTTLMIAVLFTSVLAHADIYPQPGPTRTPHFQCSDANGAQAATVKVDSSKEESKITLPNGTDVALDCNPENKVKYHALMTNASMQMAFRVCSGTLQNGTPVIVGFGQVYGGSVDAKAFAGESDQNPTHLNCDEVHDSQPQPSKWG